MCGENLVGIEVVTWSEISESGLRRAPSKEVDSNYPLILIPKMAIKTDFREMCRDSGLALTHQRQVIFDTLASMHHPTPEEVFEEVRKAIPSISHATVYKTLHTFVEHGILRELSPHHGTLRVDMGSPHHHAICTKCKTVIDIEPEAVGPIELAGHVPNGFKIERVAVEVRGLCATCAARAASSASQV
jgi:Fur family peroxide stress response transcriptional regulator